MSQANAVMPCSPWDLISCTFPTAASAAITGYAVQSATEILWNLSGKQFGLCEYILRPCRRDCAGGAVWPFDEAVWGGGGPRPLLFDGQWFNITCGGCGSGCSCTGLEEAILPGPVHAITQVKLNGTIMATGTYRLDHNPPTLIRVDGGLWPVCQDLAAADDQPNTWSVTAQFGQPVPVSGQFAVGELAAEIAKACLGQACAIPANATQVSRQGVTINLSTVSQVLKDGWTGLRMCDLFIAAVNPNHLTAPPVVYDVDGPSWRYTGT